MIGLFSEQLADAERNCGAILFIRKSSCTSYSERRCLQTAASNAGDSFKGLEREKLNELQSRIGFVSIYKVRFSLWGQ